MAGRPPQQSIAAFWNHLVSRPSRQTARTMSYGVSRTECVSLVLGGGYLGVGAIRTKFDARAARKLSLGQLAGPAYLLALAVTLAGCSASEVLQNWTPAPAAATAPDLSQPNYRRVVADNIKTIFPNSASLGDLAISEVRLVDHVKGPAWITCLKFHAHVDPVGQSAPNSTTPGGPVVAQSAPSSTTTGNPQYYAIFIQGDKIIDSRLGVAIDQCRNQTFQPFDLSPPAATKKG
jgi:hypothetical protein